MSEFQSEQAQHLEEVTEKVHYDYSLQKEFESMSYFGYTEIMDKTLLCKEKELINNEKLRG